MTETRRLMDERTRTFRDAAARGIDESENAYKGIHEHAKTGLHAHIAEVVREYVPAGSVLLDLASGAGALALRLCDAGYQMHACDYVHENFRLPSIPFMQVDLNQNFSALYDLKFDAVVASEIVEHVENPRHLLQEIAKLLKPSGRLILTTPNPDSPVSKAMYLAFGHFAWFGDSDYVGQGHITPISIRMLRQCAAEFDLRIERLTTFGSSWDHVRGWPRFRAYSYLVSLLDGSPKDLRGDVIVSVLSMMAADSERGSSGPR